MTNRHRRVAALVAVPLAALMLACGAGSTEDTAATPPPADLATAPETAPSSEEWTPEERASIDAAARASGIPPKPDAKTAAEYVAALEAVDPDIVAGKPERVVDRGRNQCTSIHNWPNDRAKLIDNANYRFSTGKHPDGFGQDKGGKIVDIVHKYLCPDFPMGRS